MPDLRAAVTSREHAPAWVSGATAALGTGASASAGAGAGRHVLVAHSGAGRLVAGVRGAGSVQSIVLVDAGLPGEPTHRAGVPPGFDEFLSSLTDADGRLPPWPDWWPPGALDAIVPDAGMRSLLADAPRVPATMFDERLPPECASVDDRVQRVAYLAFGDGYASEAAEAARRGWTVERTDGAHHLHHLVDPDAVAARIVRLSEPPAA